jgi:hypothetical protein
LTVAFGLELRCWYEAQGCGVHAIPKAGGTWTIVEYVTEVGLCMRRSHFGSLVAEHPVRFGRDVRRVERPREARPAGAGILLIERAEKWFAETMST